MDNKGDVIYRHAAIESVGDVHPLDYNAQAIVARLKSMPAAVKATTEARWLTHPNPDRRRWSYIL